MLHVKGSSLQSRDWGAAAATAGAIAYVAEPRRDGALVSTQTVE
ncbi:MAG: hypothetical protein AB1714_18160 [Acidobacteriota bacterium]